MKVAALHCNALRTRPCACRFPPGRRLIARLCRSRDFVRDGLRAYRRLRLVWRAAMHVIRRRGWEIPERLATPEHLFVNRRGLLAASAAAALSLAPKLAFAQRISDLPDHQGSLFSRP